VKFLCEQCKAKYQISDDKVAGKTVRMKCRKCGHMIEVRAEVTETSVSRSMPKEALARADGAPQAAGSASSSTPSGSGAAAVRTPPPGRATRASDAGPASSTNSRGGLATSLSGRKPLAPRAQIAPLPTSGAEAGRSSQPPGSGALAGAFQKSIAKDDPALRDITGLKEWYVAINGVPVGPVRVAELRRKASLGAVTEDSLVWQEGMEEWRPVKAYSELLALVREAAQSGRPPLAVTGDVRQSTPPPPGKGGYVPRGAGAVNHPPQPPEAYRSAGRSNVLPFAPRNAAAEKLEDPEQTEVAVSSLSQQQTVKTPVPAEALDPFAVPTVGGVRSSEHDDPFRPGPAAGEARTRAPLSVQISPASGSVVSPFAASANAGAAAAPHFGTNAGDRSSVSLGPPMLASEAPPQKKAPPWIPIAMVALAGAFGITAALVVFRRPTPVAVTPPPPAAVDSTQESPVPPPPPATTTDIELPSDTPAASGSGDKGAGAKASASASKPAGSTSSGSKTADLSDLLKGTGNGPSNGGGGGGAASAGGGSLSEDQIRSVLNQHSLGVRRNCWERATSQQSVVNVTVRLNVSGSGQVSSANADGNEPAIAKCIESSVRSWTFPATGGVSTVNIPFKFVRQ